MRRKHLEITSLNKQLVSRIYKELSKLNNKKINQILKWVKCHNIHVSKQDMWTADKMREN